jgi:hypothetical protein
MVLKDFRNKYVLLDAVRSVCRLLYLVIKIIGFKVSDVLH